MRQSPRAPVTDTVSTPALSGSHRQAPSGDFCPAVPADPPDLIDLRDCVVTTQVDVLTTADGPDPLPCGVLPVPIDAPVSVRTTLRPPDPTDDLLLRLRALPPDSPARGELRHQVVETKLPLVRHLALRFQGRGEPLDDLIQVGVIGLLHAVDRFDPERGNFTGFAVPTIVGEIRRHFRDRGWALRVPRRLQDLGRNVAKAREELTHRLERSPTAREVADHLGTEPELVLEAMETSGAQLTVPLQNVSEENGSDVLGVPDHGLNLVEDRVTLQPLLARLPTRERTILALRFVQGLSQSQIAQEVGVSQMHVSRLITRSLATLRQGLIDNP